MDDCLPVCRFLGHDAAKDAKLWPVVDVNSFISRCIFPEIARETDFDIQGPVPSDAMIQARTRIRFLDFRKYISFSSVTEAG